MIRIPKNQTDILLAAATGFVIGLVAALLLLIQFRQSILPWMIDYETSRPEASQRRQQEATKRSDTPQRVKPEEPVLNLSDFIPVNPKDVQILRSRNLLFPLPGYSRSEIRDTFNHARGGNRRHEGIDLLAARNTPIHAVDNGAIAKMWKSQYGGITIYQFDPKRKYVYYYAHLERYASGIGEGKSVNRGQIIGYVGTTGNAPRDTPHLHFAIYKLTEKKLWWEGTAVNPYEVYVQRG